MLGPVLKSAEDPAENRTGSLPSEAGSVHLSESELPGGAMVPEEDAFTADHPWTPAETRGLIH